MVSETPSATTIRSSNFRAFYNLAVRYLTTPRIVLGWILVILLLYLVLYPVVELVVQSFQLQGRDAIRFRGQSAGDWTLYYWQRALASQLSQRIFVRPLINTLIISSGYTALAMLIGTVLAWLVVRTDMPWGKLVGSLAMIPYILPSWTLGLSWITFFRHDGQLHGIKGMLQSLTGIQVPEWLVYGPVPIIIVLAMNYFAYTYLLASAAFATVDSSLEEAAEIHGASRGYILRRITMPIILPALASAFVLTFASGLGTFGVPAYLGRPANFEVMSTYLYGNMQLGRTGDAYVLATVLIILAAITVYLNSLILGARRQFTTMTGKGTRKKVTSLGVWRYPIGVLAVLFTAFAGLLPICLLVLQSLQKRLGDYSLSNLTLDYWIGKQVDVVYKGVLLEPRVMKAALNTTILGLSVGAISVIGGLLLGYVIARGRGTRLSRIVEQLSFLPYIVPGVAFGAMYLSIWAVPRGPLPALYGSLALLILASAVKRMPYAARTGISTMLQIGNELEEAATIHGASWFTTVRRILAPLARHGLFAGFILTFVGVSKDLSLVVMLVSARTEVLPVTAFGYVDAGVDQLSYAVAVIIIVIVLLGTALAKKLTKGDPMEAFKNAGGGG